MTNLFPLLTPSVPNYPLPGNFDAMAIFSCRKGTVEYPPHFNPLLPNDPLPGHFTPCPSPHAVRKGGGRRLFLAG